MSIESSDIRDEWLKLEIAVAAKKVEAKMAHIKTLYKYYSIAIQEAR
jgi:hypothetical protein